MISERNIIEQQFLPSLFYGNRKQEVIESLIKNKELFVHELLRTFYKTDGFQLLNKKEDFEVMGFKLNSVVNAIVIEMPLKENYGDCSRIIIFHSTGDNYSKVCYFTSQIQWKKSEKEEINKIFCYKPEKIIILGEIKTGDYIDELEQIKDELAVCYDYFVQTNLDYLRNLENRLEKSFSQKSTSL